MTGRYERIAHHFHDAYESLAPQHGYETRQASRKPWHEVPAQNRALMTNVVAELAHEGHIVLPDKYQRARACRGSPPPASAPPPGCSPAW